MKKHCQILLLSIFTLLLVIPCFAAEEQKEEKKTGALATEPASNRAESETAVSETKDKSTSRYQLGEIEVKAKQLPKEGSTEAGYRAENVVTTGPWGGKRLQDTPYSISVISSEMIENVGASSPDQLFRVNPLTQVNYPQARAGNVPISIRGFRFNTSTAEDGMRNTNGYGIFLEDKERVEVLTGLSGFLYGPANVGGLVNYVTKRPTAERLNSITVGDYGGSSAYAHGDFGGKIDKNGKFAYRLNILVQDGDTPVDYQSINRNLISAALDWHVTNNILLQGSASRSHYKVDGLPAYWARATGVRTPDAPDPEKLWTQKWTFSEIDTDRAGINGRWDINDMFTLRAAYSYIENEREWHAVNTTIRRNGTYTQLAKMQAPFRIIDNGGYGFFDTNFKTASIRHKLTAGFYGSANKFRYHQDASVDIPLTGNFSLSDPVYVSEPRYSVGTRSWYTGSKSSNQNWIIGDDIKFNDRWSALVGLNNVTIEQRSYNADGSEKPNSHYDKNANTLTGSLIYKPLPSISVYASYMESLEQGTIVPGTGTVSYTNGGEILEPLKSEQYEVGAKTTLGGMSLTAALFYIDKANEYDRTNADGTHTYVQDGREVHKGVEFTAIGKVMEHLTLFGGVTVLDAKIKRSNNPNLENKAPMDVAEQMAKLYAEYDFPYVRGLTFTGGVYYTGTFYGDTLNTDKLSSVITGDVGARYTAKVFDKPLTLRLNVTNVTNESYWISNYYTGDPRTITFSAQLRF